jgi:hypothetical protein
MKNTHTTRGKGKYLLFNSKKPKHCIVCKKIVRGFDSALRCSKCCQEQNVKNYLERKKQNGKNKRT